LPVGIVTSLLGSPFFIYLLQRSHYMRSSNGRP
jgi:ABC-type Fe3+-siderophore transport system permease subunit